MRAGARDRLALTAALALLAQSLVGVAPSAAQEGGVVPAGVWGRDYVVQSIEVPVFPGQTLRAMLVLPTLENAPLPAVLLIAVRASGRAPAAAARAMAEALLARGIAVVRLDLPPVDADSPAGGDPGDDAFAVLQYLREREDLDGDRLAIVAVGRAAAGAVRTAGLDEPLRALVLLDPPAEYVADVDPPASHPLLVLPLESRAAPASAASSDESAAPVTTRAAAFLARHLQ